MVDSVIAEAVGSASNNSDHHLDLDRVMGNAVHAASKECEVIWADVALSLKEKNERIAAIQHPDEIRRRMLAARDKAHAEFGAAADLARKAEADRKAAEGQ